MPLDLTTILPIKEKFQNIDVALTKKNDVSMEDILKDHDYCLKLVPSLSAVAENVVHYISGYVVKMAKKKIYCSSCIEALEDETSSNLHSSKLLLRKQRGISNSNYVYLNM